VRPRSTALALLAVAAVVVPAAVGAGSPSQRERALRDRDQALASQSRAAVLDLYALETKLARAQSRLTALDRKTGQLRHEQAVVGEQLRVARRGVRITQRRLAERLRALYEQGEIDPLAIVLGSGSVDAALTGLENIDRIASGDRKVLRALRTARADLTALRRQLQERRARLAALSASARTTATSLGDARSARVAYISALASERRLTRAAIGRLQARARAAQAKAQTLEQAPQVSVAAMPAEREPAVRRQTDASPQTDVSPVDEVPADGERTLTVASTGYVLPGVTATGLPVGWGVVAVDPSVIPLGTRMTVPGYGEAVAADVGGSVRGATIDLWFPSLAEAHRWGRRTVTVTLH